MHTPLNHLNLLDKARRAHRQAMRKDASIPALVPAAGKIMANGALRAVLPTVDGGAAVYRANPCAEWRWQREAPFTRLKARFNGVSSAPPASPSDRFKRAFDDALSALAEIERRARAAESPTRIAAE